MKKTVLGATTALVLIGSSAFAADMAVRPFAPPPAPLPAFSWTGWYLGGHGGYGWTTSDGLNANGGFVGGQLGYNYQIGNFVLGIEGDGSWADISQTVNGIAFGVPVSATFKDDALASLRGRLGVTWGNVLFYGTVGGGWGHGQLSGTALGLTASSDAWQSGWTAGAGVEWAFAPSWSAKVEYIHYGLGSATYFGGINSGNVDIDTVKVGINFLFH
jgi:outer membrane immunogenic protein